MRIFTVFRFLSAGTIFVAAPLPVLAQDSGAAAPALEIVEVIETPQPTPRARNDAPDGVTEKRARGGRVTEIQVRNNGSTYYLRPQLPIGSALPGDTQSGAGRTAQWNILNFELPRSAGPNTGRVESDARLQAPLPPPPRTN